MLPAGTVFYIPQYVRKMPQCQVYRSGMRPWSPALLVMERLIPRFSGTYSTANFRHALLAIAIRTLGLGRPTLISGHAKASRLCTCCPVAARGRIVGVQACMCLADTRIES